VAPDPDDQPPGDPVAGRRRHYRPCAPLSREEDGILDEIEHDVAESDPGLAARISQLGDPPPLPLLARCAGGLSLGAIVLILASALPAAAAWVLLLLVAAAVVLPSLLPDGTEVRPRP
jgi:hypothetical protein